MLFYKQKKPSSILKTLCFGITIVLMALASLVNAKTTTEFSNMINSLDDMPTELSSHDIEFGLIKKNNSLPTHLFYGTRGHRVLGIGKVETPNTYVVLVGDVVSTVLSDFNLIVVHGYNFTKQGKLINREPFICIAGVVPTTKIIHSCQISFKNKPALSVWKDSIQNAKTTRRLDMYIINPQGKLIHAKH